VSWIHEEDFVAAISWLIHHEELAGPVNIAAPNPLPNADFMRALREALDVPLGLPATAWMLEIGALFLGTETELILKSRRVVPGRLLNDGSTFRFPQWPEAARDLCRRWRERRSGLA
jgi:NAD dependent epimerase/dehydratase family enzyme